MAAFNEVIDALFCANCMEAELTVKGFVSAGVFRVAPETVAFPENETLDGLAVGPWTRRFIERVPAADAPLVPLTPYALAMSRSSGMFAFAVLTVTSIDRFGEA